MSLLKQNKSFAASMAASASKFTKKTLPNKPASTPSSFSTSQRDTPEPSATPAMAKQQVFSQPADTGKGNTIQTQVVYAVDYLKQKMGGGSLSLETILSYLSQSHAEDSYKIALSTILKRHPQVKFDSKAYGGKGGYKFRPKHDIASADDLLKALQDFESFRGLDVKELKEGWPTIDKTIDELEKAHKIIVLRHKKDGSPRFVYWDNADWHLTVDREFQDLWFKQPIPAEHQALIDELVRDKQTPAGKKDKREIKTANRVDKKKPRKSRGGKVTNKHMSNVFKDYSHIRR